MEWLRVAANVTGLAAVGVARAIPEVQGIYGWAESVVVAAISYLPPESEPEDDKPRGLVARFARSADYHTILLQKLARLGEALRSEHRASAKIEICVDTCPLPERKLALLGGIAWRGKNGNVFVEGHGSYIVLGEIVTDLKLAPSTTLSIDRCGDCARCIEACPTGAIIAPFTVEGDRCVSRLTQISGIIPPDLRPRMGNRIYGCDICQEVCPQNARLEPVPPEFAAKVFPGADPEIIPLIELTAREFEEKVKPSSIGWIRRARIRRNAVVAAGNLKCRSAIPALEAALHDPNPTLREHAAWAIESIRNS